MGLSTIEWNVQIVKLKSKRMIFVPYAYKNGKVPNFNIVGIVNVKKVLIKF